MKKMHNTTPIKDKKIILTIEPPKVRTQITTCKSATYSYYSKAQRKIEKRLKNNLKRLDIENL